MMYFDHPALYVNSLITGSGLPEDPKISAAVADLRRPATAGYIVPYFQLEASSRQPLLLTDLVREYRHGSKVAIGLGINTSRPEAQSWIRAHQGLAGLWDYLRRQIPVIDRVEEVQPVQIVDWLATSLKIAGEMLSSNDGDLLTRKEAINAFSRFSDSPRLY